MKKNKTVSQLEKELENLAPLSYLGPDGIQKRLRHSNESKLLEEFSKKETEDKDVYKKGCD